MSDQVLRIGIVGGGSVVRSRHMLRLQAIPNVEVVAVCNRRRASAERFAADYGVGAVYDHWTQVVADPEIDIVWIGATPYLHARVSVAALDAHKHVFCQARMARNLAEARAMVAAADRHPDRVAAVCPLARLGDATMRRLLRREWFVGTVRQVRLNALLGGQATPGPELHWRQDFEVSGHNALSVGMHAEVLHRWVGLAASLQARTDTHTRLRRDPETGECVEVRVPDSVSVIGRLVSGADFVYQWSGVADLGPPAELWVFGDEGTLVYDFQDEVIRGAKLGDGALEAIPIPEHERLVAEVEDDFVRAIRQGGDTGLAPDFGTAMQYVEFLEAVMRSARAGRRVTLPLD
jgi:predicted dehydrogenase